MAESAEADNVRNVVRDSHANVVIQARWIEGDINVHVPQHVTAPPTQIVVGDIPRKPADFQERAPLLAQLTASNVSVVIGGRGFGKTQLAAAYARRRIADGWPVVAWIDARTEGLMVAGWENIARAIGITCGNSAQAALTGLEQLDKPSLVVFDNADDPALLRAWLPRHGQTQVVVTTLSRDVEDLGTTVEAELFTDEEAAAFLRARTGLPDEGASALIAELDRLPLALAHAAAVIRRQRISCTTYLERLRTYPVERYLPQHVGDPYPWSTAQAILLSTDVAENADDTGLTWALLAVLSTMPTAARWVLHTMAAESMASGPADVDAALGILADNSIITLSLDGVGVAMHRVTARVVRDREASDGRIDGIILVGCQGLETLTSQPGWPKHARAEHLVDQIDTLYTGSQRNDIPAVTTKRLLGLRRWAASYLLEAAEPARAVAACAALIADHQNVFGTHDSVLITGLASAYLRAKQFDKAIELLTEQLTTATDAQTADLCRSNLAKALEQTGHINEAISLHEETMHRRKLALGERHSQTLMAALHLARICSSADRLEDGIALLAPAETYRVSDPDTIPLLILDVRNSLADMYSKANRSAEAVALLKSTIADWRQTQPDDTIPMLESCRHLVHAYARTQRFDEAIALCESLDQAITAQQHPTALALRYELAETYLVVGRTTDAIDAFTTLVTDAESVLGPEHPYTVNCQTRLAHAHRLQIVDDNGAIRQDIASIRD